MTLTELSQSKHKWEMKWRNDYIYICVLSTFIYCLTRPCRQRNARWFFILGWWSRQAVYLLTQYQCLSVCLSKLQINCESHITALVQKKKQKIEKFKFTRAERVNTKRSMRFLPSDMQILTNSRIPIKKTLMSDSIQRQPHTITVFLTFYTPMTSS